MMIILHAILLNVYPSTVDVTDTSTASTTVMKPSVVWFHSVVM